MSRHAASTVLRRPADETQIVASPVFTSSLCANCDQADCCALPPRASSQPVIHCEEWSAAGPVPGPAAKPVVRIHPWAAAAATASGALPKGLCANCELFPTCSFVKPDEGVWHCEEYA